jgi:hypothetical protein
MSSYFGRVNVKYNRGIHMQRPGFLGDLDNTWFGEFGRRGRGRGRRGGRRRRAGRRARRWANRRRGPGLVGPCRHLRGPRRRRCLREHFGDYNFGAFGSAKLERLETELAAALKEKSDRTSGALKVPMLGMKGQKLTQYNDQQLKKYSADYDALGEDKFRLKYSLRMGGRKRSKHGGHQQFRTRSFVKHTIKIKEIEDRIDDLKTEIKEAKSEAKAIEKKIKTSGAAAEDTKKLKALETSQSKMIEAMQAQQMQIQQQQQQLQRGFFARLFSIFS